MSRKIMIGVTALGLGLGLLHLGLTLPLHGGMTLQALWFGGSGLAIVLGSLCNWLALQNPRVSGGWIPVLVNLLLAGFFAVAWSLMPAPQVIAGLVIFSITTTYFAVQVFSPRRPTVTQ